MNWFRKLMAGRYGVDQLAVAQLIAGIILALMFRFFPYAIIRLSFFILLINTYFRIFSRNINKRYLENIKFLKFWNPIKNKYKKEISRLKSRRDFKYFKCTFCDQKIRIPRGKGKIKVTCPKCKNVTIKNT